MRRLYRRYYLIRNRRQQIVRYSSIYIRALGFAMVVVAHTLCSSIACSKDAWLFSGARVMIPQ
jgi:hypothetical protein